MDCDCKVERIGEKSPPRRGAYRAGLGRSTQPIDRIYTHPHANRVSFAMIIDRSQDKVGINLGGGLAFSRSIKIEKQLN
jgi:hypothetical protein